MRESLDGGWQRWLPRPKPRWEVGSSLKAAWDRDWDDPQERQEALVVVLDALTAVEGWWETQPASKEEPVVQYSLQAAEQIKEQDVHLTEGQPARLRKGVAKDRRISIEDAHMRHGRKSRSVGVDGYKRHALRDLDTGLVQAVGITPANAAEATVTDAIKADLACQQVVLRELHIDRAYPGFSQAAWLLDRCSSGSVFSPKDGSQVSQRRHHTWWANTPKAASFAGAEQSCSLYPLEKGELAHACALGCFRSLNSVKQAEACVHKADIRQSQGKMNMFMKILLAFTGLGAVGVVAIYLLTIPLLRRLPKPSRVSMDGVTTIDDAVEACRRTQLHGWDLVAYAQNLAARKFTYSRLNTWDTPSRAFERGMGYCEQQTLALKKIYDRLGIESRPVFAFRVVVRL